MTEKFDHLLSCGHTVVYAIPAKHGETVPCIRCNKVVTVTSSKSFYNLRCRNCSYKRYGIKTLDSANTSANKHLYKCPTHAVRLWQPGNSKQTILKMSNDALPLDVR